MGVVFLGLVLVFCGCYVGWGGVIYRLYMGGVFICLCITVLCCRTYYYIIFFGKIFVFCIIVIYIWGVSVVDRG